jgi:hypothetical protein
MVVDVENKREEYELIKRTNITDLQVGKLQTTLCTVLIQDCEAHATINKRIAILINAENSTCNIHPSVAHHVRL